jgi:hypothetical protein
MNNKEIERIVRETFGAFRCKINKYEERGHGDRAGNWKMLGFVWYECIFPNGVDVVDLDVVVDSIGANKGRMWAYLNTRELGPTIYFENIPDFSKQLDDVYNERIAPRLEGVRMDEPYYYYGNSVVDWPDSDGSFSVGSYSDELFEPHRAIQQRLQVREFEHWLKKQMEIGTERAVRAFTARQWW